MGNTLKSMNSRKSYNLQHTREVFKDYSTLEPFASGEEEIKVETENCKRGLMKWGLPKRADPIYHRAGYSMGYDYERRVPLWVIEKLDNTNYRGEKLKARRQLDFYDTDTEMYPFNARIEDYVSDDMKTKGYHKGQLAEIKNHIRRSIKEMMSCYIMSNTAPQKMSLHDRFMNSLNYYIRELGKKYDTWVVTGTLFEKAGDVGEPYRRLGYAVVGEKNIGIPTHFFKIILAEISSHVYLSCIVVPNAEYNDHDYREIKLEHLEELSGLQFPIMKMMRKFDLLEKCPLNIEQLRIESQMNPKQWKKYHRKLQQQKK